MKSAWQFFMNFRGPKAHPNRGEKAPRGVGSEPGDRQDWQRISGKMRRKSMPVLSVPGALVGGDEVSMAVFHELSRAEGPSQQTGLTANFRQSQPEIHVRLVSPWVPAPSGHPPPGFVGVVGAQGLEFAPQGCLAQRIEQALDRGEIQMLAADHQVAASAGARDEIQAKGARGGAGGNTTSAQARVD